MEFVAVSDRKTMHLSRSEYNLICFGIFHTLGIKITTATFPNNGVVRTAAREMDVTMGDIRVKTVVTTHTFKTNIAAGLCVDISGLMCPLNAV